MNESDKCRALQANFKTPEIFKLSLEDQLCYLQSSFVKQKFNVFWLKERMLEILRVENLEISFVFFDNQTQVVIRFLYDKEKSICRWNF